MKTSLSALLLLALCLPVAAQRGTIEGTVTDAGSGEALPGVNVVIEGTALGVSTGFDGRFVLAGLKPGTYTAVAQMLGYKQARQPVTVAAGQVAALAFRLEAQPITLEGVLAQADRPFSTASSQAIRRFDLLTRPVRSAQDLLQLAPGLVTAQHAGGGKAEQIFLRGFDADHGTDVALSVDGMPVNMVSHGHGQGYADLHFVIPETVEEIEVVKGPYAAQYGNLATAGAVAFATRDHLDENTVRVEGGGFGTGGVTALFQLPTPGAHQGAYFAGQFSRTDGPFQVPQDFNRVNLFGRFHTHLSDAARLSASVSGFSSAWDASGQIPQRAVAEGVISRFGSIDSGEGGTTGRQDVNVIYEATGARRDFRLQAYAGRYNFKLFSNFTFFLENPDRGDMIEQTDNRALYGADGRYRLYYPVASAFATTTLGGGFRADDIAVQLWQSPDRLRAATLVDAAIAERNLYLWGQQEWTFNPFVRLQLGLRADYFTFNVDDHLEGRPAALPHASGYAQDLIVSPKASLVVSPLSTLDLFASAGTGFHSNDARDVVLGGRINRLAAQYRREALPEDEIARRLADQNLDPAQEGATTLPRAVGAEVGARVQPIRRLRLSTALWLLDLESEFVYVGDGGFTEPSGRSRRYGLDVEARLSLLPWLSTDADLNLSRGVLRDEPEGANQIPLAPRLTATGGLTARHPSGFSGSLRLTHVGSRPADETGSITAEGYTLVNVFASRRFGALTLSAALENLFDVAWNEAQFATESRLRGEATAVNELHFTPGRPRNLRLGIAYAF